MATVTKFAKIVFAVDNTDKFVTDAERAALGISTVAPNTYRVVGEEATVDAWIARHSGATLASVPKAPISVIDFKIRFTSAERQALYASADPVVVDIIRLLDDQRLTSVDLNAQWVTDMLTALVNKSILTAQRALAIAGD